MKNQPHSPGSALDESDTTINDTRLASAPVAAVAHLLRNRFYIGEVLFKGETLSGEQSAIIDRDLIMDGSRTIHH